MAGTQVSMREATHTQAEWGGGAGSGRGLGSQPGVRLLRCMPIRGAPMTDVFDSSS